MKINELRERLRQDRAMAAVSLRMPEDVLDTLKHIAPLLGFASYEALMRAYIGQGLRTDLERLEANPKIATLIESLRRHGVADDVIASAVADVKASDEAA